MDFPIQHAHSFNSYINYVYSVPNLSAEEEFELAIKYKEQGDLDAARKLITSHLKVVVSVARGYEGYKLPLEDLVQEGTIGLMRAVKKFDPSRGIRLVSVALIWIKHSIQEFIVRNWRLVKIATTHEQRKLFFNLRSLKKGFMPLKPDEISAIAKQLNVSEKDVVEMETRFASIPLFIDHHDDEDHIFELPDDHEHQPENIVAESEEQIKNHTLLKNGLDKLDQRRRYIIDSRYLCEPEKVKTLHELAAELKISAERVRQLEVEALKILKQHMVK